MPFEFVSGSQKAFLFSASYHTTFPALTQAKIAKSPQTDKNPPQIVSISALGISLPFE